MKKLPTVKSLKAEYAELLAEKKALYSDYYKLKNEQRDLLIHKANIERIMQLDEEEKERSRQHQQEEKSHQNGAQPQKNSAISKGVGDAPQQAK